MTDLYMEFNEDLVITPSGSLQVAIGWDQIRERIIRNLITNPSIKLPDGTQTAPDYIFEPQYGLGMGALVDSNPTEQNIATLERNIRQAVFSDANVNPGSPPTIVFQRPTPSIFQVFISVDLINANVPSGQFSMTL